MYLRTAALTVFLLVAIRYAVSLQQPRYHSISNRLPLHVLFSSARDGLSKHARTVQDGSMDEASCSRRKMVKDTTLRLATTLAILCQKPRVASAACLSGDTSPDCIGVYKMPIDDAALPYVGTPEKLSQFAPDVRWVPPVEYPKSYKDAVKEMKELKDSLQAVSDLVMKGSLTEAGTQLLRILPRATVAGRVIVKSLNNESPSNKEQNDDKSVSMKGYRAEVALDSLLPKLAECDLMIGQAIAGDLGSLTAAQIQILSELKEANTYLADFLEVL